MTNILPSPRAAMGAMAAAVLMCAAALSARAQDELVLLENVRYTTYLNGGVGKEDEAYMRKVAKDWPLRIVFSERKDTEFVANADLTITDQRGAPVLVLNNTGPMTYVMLPAGKFRVTASHHGVTESRAVTLDGNQGKDLYFRWQGKPKIDPWDGKPVGGKQAPG